MSVNIEKGGMLLSSLMLVYTLFNIGVEYYTDGLLDNDGHSVSSLAINIILAVLIIIFPPGKEGGEKYWRLLAIALAFYLFRPDPVLITYFILFACVVLEMVAFRGFYLLDRENRESEQ